MELCFITSNDNKAKEVSLFLGRELTRKSLQIPEIQAVIVEEVVKDKALKAYNIIKRPVLVEDTGLFLKYLNDFPGAMIKWLLESVGPEGICEIVKDKDRRAYAETSFCMYDGEAFHLFTGRADGTITDSPRGSNGFGWDSIFQPKGLSATFAEITTEEKNKISHRGRALMKLKEYLESHSS